MISILSILGFSSNDSNYHGEVGGVDAVEQVLSQRRHGRAPPEDPDGPDSELNRALNALRFDDLNEVEGTRVEGKWQDGVVVPYEIAEADI